MSRQAGVVRAYRALLLLLPQAVRERDGEEMVATFAAMWSAAAGRAGRFACFLRSFGWLPLVALAEWRDHLEATHRTRRGRRGGVDVDGITLLYMVGTERRELGIRLAPGARRRSLEARVLGRGLGTAASGAVVGGVGAWASGRLLQNRLYGVEAGDPATLATARRRPPSHGRRRFWVPARRAAATDPVETIRQE